MNLNVIAIAWALLQITLLCGMALVVALLLRGRRPQWVTAMLAGTCIASMILAGTSLFPICQWSWALPSNESLVDRQEPRFDQPESRQYNNSTETEAQETIKSSLNDASELHLTQEPSPISKGPDHSGMQSIQRWISHYLHRVDNEVRQVEDWQRPIAQARNISLFVLLGFGLVCMSLLWCSSWICIRTVLRSSHPIDDSEILQVVTELSKSFGLKPVPSVRESRLVPIGATVGWLKVSVLLHPEWRAWSPQERAAVIAHELAHASRRDFVCVMLASWTRIVLFFHPLIHLLVQRLRLEQELAADQLAAGKLGSAKAYGRALASLSLRSQHNLDASNAQLGAMLSAGQICITRRITMLRQGSLKPIQQRSRWALWTVIGIALSAVPLAGLRGTTQEPRNSESTVAQEPGGDSATETSQNEDAKFEPSGKTLSKEFLESYPPVVVDSLFVYRPSRLRAGEFGPEVAWLQDMYTTVIAGKPLSERSVVFGKLSHRISWLDEERKHGSYSMGPSVLGIRNGEVGQLTSMLATESGFSGYPMRLISHEQVDGRTIAGVANYPTDTPPSRWLIDDREGSFCGSLEDARRFVKEGYLVEDSVPDRFRENVDQAAVSVVFGDCDSLFERLSAHQKGSPKESEFAILEDLLVGLKQVGIFIDGCRSPACHIRAVMQDDATAKRAAARTKMLVEMGKLALIAAPKEQPSMDHEVGESILKTIQIEAAGAELQVSFDIFVPSLRNNLGVPGMNALNGWLNSPADFLVSESHSGEVTLKSPSGLFGPGFLGQAIDAREVRGRTVELTFDIQCSTDVMDQVGGFVLSSRQEKVNSGLQNDRVPLQQDSSFVNHRTISAKTVSADGQSSFPERSKHLVKCEQFDFDSNAEWKKIRLRYNVPTNAEHLSFGCYLIEAEIAVRNFDFGIVEGSSATNEVAMDATSHLPVNLFVSPGQEVGSKPKNLQMEKASTDSVRQASKSKSESVR